MIHDDLYAQKHSQVKDNECNEQSKYTHSAYFLYLLSKLRS